jgi:hypothetical protein
MGTNVELRRDPLMICAMGGKSLYPLDDWAVVQWERGSVPVPGLGTIDNDAALSAEHCRHGPSSELFVKFGHAVTLTCLTRCGKGETRLRSSATIGLHTL